MMNEIENRMIVDSEWDEQEYRIPSKSRLKRLKRAYEEEEIGYKDEDY